MANSLLKKICLRWRKSDSYAENIKRIKDPDHGKHGWNSRASCLNAWACWVIATFNTPHREVSYEDICAVEKAIYRIAGFNVEGTNK